jgi:hypothetical protein
MCRYTTTENHEVDISPFYIENKIKYNKNKIQYPFIVRVCETRREIV